MEWLADAGTRHVVRGRMGVNWRIWGGGAANPFRVCGGACRPIGKPPSVGERAEPGSSVTRRWREMDSNPRSRLARRRSDRGVPMPGSNPPTSTASRPPARRPWRWRIIWAEIGRRHCGRRLLVHDPCPPRRRGDRRGPVRDGIDHAWRERPLRRRAHSQCRGANEPRRPVRAALWANGAADFVHDPGALRRPHQRPQKLLVLAAHSIPPPARARIDCGA